MQFSEFIAPILTRWLTWLNAASYYADNLPQVTEIVNGLEEIGLLVQRAKDAVNEDDVDFDYYNDVSHLDSVQCCEAIRLYLLRRIKKNKDFEKNL